MLAPRGRHRLGVGDPVARRCCPAICAHRCPPPSRCVHAEEGPFCASHFPRNVIKPLSSQVPRGGGIGTSKAPEGLSPSPRPRPRPLSVASWPPSRMQNSDLVCPDPGSATQIPDGLLWPCVRTLSQICLIQMAGSQTNT